MYYGRGGQRPAYGAKRGGYQGSGFIDFARAPMNEIRQHLLIRNLDAAGSDGILRSRLQRFVTTLSKQPATASMIEYLVVIDFEACCADDDLLGERPKAGTYEQEIIEFPAILVDVKQQKVIDTFHSYVKPTREVNRTLTAFCKTLTGISQETVDAACIFPVVVKHLETWLDKHGLLGKKNWTTVADGRFDHGLFIHQACKVNNVPYPEYMINYCKLPRTFKVVYRQCFPDPTAYPPTLAEMLELYGMVFEGREHCGLDDAKNLTRVVLKMLHDQVELRPTERVHPEELDEERPFCCKTRGLIPGEWEELRKAILDPTYVPKAVGQGDGRPWDEVQNLLVRYNLPLTGSEGIQRSRLTLHQTWLQYGMEKPIVHDHLVVFSLQVAEADVGREVGSFAQQITQISAAVIDVQTATTVAEFDRLCGTPDTSGFAAVWSDFQAWLTKNNCIQYSHSGTAFNFCVMVASRCALPFHLYTACTANDVPYPGWALQYSKLDSLFKKFYPVCCRNVALPKLPEIVDSFGLGTPGDADPACAQSRTELARVCVAMIRDKVPIQPTEKVYLDKPEGPFKPFSRFSQALQDRDWYDIRRAIVEGKTRQSHING